MTFPVLEYYKLDKAVPDPKFGTEQSACFDLHAFFDDTTPITIYDQKNNKLVNDNRLYSQLWIVPGCRYLVPTGLKFKIPNGYSVRIHPRSGQALKQGLIIGNLEGIIDSDYFHQSFLMLTTISHAAVVIESGERLAQGELVKCLRYGMMETLDEPQQTTDRIGGWGSTGVAA